MKLGVAAKLTDGLDAAGVAYDVFDQVPPDSSMDVATEVARRYGERGCDGFVAIGGGAVSDTTKGAAASLACEGVDFATRLGSEILHADLPPFIAVPTTAGTRVATVTGPAEMLASDVVVPGAPSSAAFVAAAALLKSGSSITIQNVSLNPARIGFVRTLERMGADIRESYGGHEGKAPRGPLTVNYTPVLRGCEIPSQHIASVIDEIPVLALVAAHARGITVFHEVGELRVKESDRLQAIIDGLALLGVDAWEEGDDLFVEGNPQLQVPEGLVFESHGDHR